MIIGIDGNEANIEKRVGIGVYAFELLWQFSSSKLKVQSSKFVIYLKNEPRDDLPEESENWQYRVVKPGALWTQIGLPFDLYMHKPRPDVFFSPTHYAPRFSPIPTAVSVMDVSYLHYPQLFRAIDLYQLRHWTAYSVKNAAKIFTISKASKDDIMHEYGVPGKKVMVTYLGIKEMDTKIIDKNDLLDKYKISGEYILFVGTLQPRKNIVRLIEAFAKLVKDEKKENLTLIIIGKKGWLYEDILSAPERFAISSAVKFLHDVDNTHLPSFYTHALFFVLPSLYEGFGLPVVEAMKYGCPVITSNVSSLPEAGGDAALYVNPESVEEIQQQMKILLDNPKRRKELVEKGYKHIKQFSWEKTAQQTLAVLNQIRK